MRIAMFPPTLDTFRTCDVTEFVRTVGFSRIYKTAQSSSQTKSNDEIHGMRHVLWRVVFASRIGLVMGRIVPIV